MTNKQNHPQQNYSPFTCCHIIEIKGFSFYFLMIGKNTKLMLLYQTK